MGKTTWNRAAADRVLVALKTDCSQLAASRAAGITYGQLVSWLSRGRLLRARDEPEPEDWAGVKAWAEAVDTQVVSFESANCRAWDRATQVAADMGNHKPAMDRLERGPTGEAWQIQAQERVEREAEKAQNAAAALILEELAKVLDPEKFAAVAAGIQARIDSESD